MRDTFLPYCLPLIGEEEIAEVVDSLRSGWVTTGPKVKRFEDDFARYVEARHAIAVNSCTAALHISLAALDLGAGDEVIVPTHTFCATGNVVAHLGATPVLVDVNEHFLVTAEAIREAITPRTRAIVPVHFAGQSCDLDEILAVAEAHGIPVIEDAAHAAGSKYKGQRIGSHGKAVCFSFYAIKNLTTGEGGMITTNDDAFAARMRILALHGMSKDAWKRYSEAGSWYYEVVEHGYKQNMTDIQASMGIHQLRKLDGFIARREEIAGRYREAFGTMSELILPQALPDRNHVYHLFPVRLAVDKVSINRANFISELAARRIGASVHFIPLHRHPAFARYGYTADRFPVAERLYEGLLSLPLYPKMTDADVQDVIDAVKEIIEANRVLSRGIHGEGPIDHVSTAQA